MLTQESTCYKMENYVKKIKASLNPADFFDSGKCYNMKEKQSFVSTRESDESIRPVHKHRQRDDACGNGGTVNGGEETLLFIVAIERDYSIHIHFSKSSFLELHFHRCRPDFTATII